MKNYIIAAVSFAAMTGAAFAQQAVTPAAPATAAAGSDAIMAGPGLAMGTAATMPLKYVEIKETDLVTSKLVGVNIYNKANESVGEISDVVIERQVRYRYCCQCGWFPRYRHQLCRPQSGLRRHEQRQWYVEGLCRHHQGCHDKGSQARLRQVQKIMSFGGRASRGRCVTF